MKRGSLFEPYLVENGARRRATAAELKEAHRLWFKHRDIREGRPKTRSTYDRSAVWSSHWKRLTKAQKALAAGCERCGSTGALEVHHLTYARAGQELPEDVLVVCRRCHRKLDRLRRRGEAPHVEVTIGEAKRVVTWHTGRAAP